MSERDHTDEVRVGAMSRQDVIVIAIVGPFVVYILGFCVILVDAFVMNSYLYHHMPRGMARALEVIYWPLIELVKLFV